MPRQAQVNQPVSLRKRDGRLAAFELAKIERAIAAAGAGRSAAVPDEASSVRMIRSASAERPFRASQSGLSGT